MKRMPFQAGGVVALKGVLRLRMLLRFANQHAPLRMTLLRAAATENWELGTEN
jgi:hypothetical protein